MRSSHALFRKHPITGQVSIGDELLTTPYQIHDGLMLFLGGTVDARTATCLLANEQLSPVLDTNGRALGAVWACDFTEANLGPHLELQFSLFAAFEPVAALQAHPFAVFRALMTQPETHMVCHGLWNSTQRVVRYNCEHLHLNAEIASGAINRADERARFYFTDGAGAMIADGDVAVGGKQSPAVIWGLLKHVGFRAAMKSIFSPVFHTKVVNTLNANAAQNMVADTYCQSDRQLLRLTTDDDRITIADPRYASLDFRPDFVQLLEGVRFVYCPPRLPRSR